MADYTEEGLVLDTRNYRDRDQLLSVLTPGHGVVRGVFRGARGGRAPRAAASQLLSHVRCAVHHGPNAELAAFRNVDLILSSFPLTSHFSAATAAAAIAEMLATYCPPGEPAPRRFRLGVAALGALLAGRPADGVLAYTQLWCLRLGGFLPPLDSCFSCGGSIAAGARPEEDGLLCPDCSPTEPTLDENAVAILLGWIVEPPDAIHDSPPDGLRQYLDLTSRANAERHLKALDFHRRHGNA